MTHFILISIIIILGAWMIMVVRASQIKDLRQFKKDNYYIISDPGDEFEHIYSKKDGKRG